MIEVLIVPWLRNLLDPSVNMEGENPLNAVIIIF